MNQTPVQLQADLMADTVAFPVLSAAELAECTEFGTRCSFAPGEEIFGAGSQSFDCYVIVLGMFVSRSFNCFFPYVSPKKSPGFHTGRSVFCATKYPKRKLNRAYLTPASKSSF